VTAAKALVPGLVTCDCRTTKGTLIENVFFRALKSMKKEVE